MNGWVSCNLPILMYHHLERGGGKSPFTIPAATFASQLQYLHSASYCTLTFRRLLGLLQQGRTPSRRSVVITFDDGYESFRAFALPVLAEHKMTATVFLVAGELGKLNRWDAQNDTPERLLMSASGIQEILAAGMEIGSHGWFHRDLSRCSESDLAEEIARSRQELENRFCVQVQMFSYPFGRHSPRHFTQLRGAGYSGAVSIFSKEPTVTHNTYAMRRVFVHAGDSLIRFRLKLSPVYLRYVAWRDRTRKQFD